MKRALSLAALIALAACTLAQPGRLDGQVDTDHTQWLAMCLKEIQSIKIGITRAEVLKVFAPQGGISTRLQETLVYRKCPLIKVDVGFTATTPEDTLTDKVTEISRPYLEYPITD